MLTIEEIKARVTPICEKYKIDRMWLFGSYARGEADEKSDVDLCFEGGELHYDWGVSDFEEAIEEVLKMPFDLLNRKILSKRFLRHMKEDEVLIYARNQTD